MQYIYNIFSVLFLGFPLSPSHFSSIVISLLSVVLEDGFPALRSLVAHSVYAGSSGLSLFRCCPVQTASILSSPKLKLSLVLFSFALKLQLGSLFSLIIVIMLLVYCVNYLKLSFEKLVTILEHFYKKIIHIYTTLLYDFLLYITPI